MDIASSNFSEDTAIFGGEDNLLLAIRNLMSQYSPEVIGVATSCLTETIGDDVPSILRKLKDEISAKLIPVSTPSFKGSHIVGFHSTVDAIVRAMCTEPSVYSPEVFIAPPVLSPADLRYIKTICKKFGINPILLPDYSDTLDGGVWDKYTPIPEGGTPIEDISKAASAESSFIELGNVREGSAGFELHKKFGTHLETIGTPIGIEATDRFLNILAQISGKEIPDEYIFTRKRCIDSYIDAHKYLSGVRTVIYGDEDMVPAITSFCCEIGLKPVLCASEGPIAKEIEKCIESKNRADIMICEDADFDAIENQIASLKPDLMIGTGKGNHISIKYDIPLLRVGFPIHDRFGASRILHVGYDGAMQLLDSIVNLIVARKQINIPDGYSYL
jgi:nitrogenase molybdenum-iron protein NifN